MQLVLTLKIRILVLLSIFSNVNSFAQLYNVDFELLTEVDSCSSFGSVSEIAYIDSFDPVAVSIGFNFLFGSFYVDSIRILPALGGLEFVGLEEGIPNVSSMGIFLRLDSVNNPKIGYYRSANSVCIFWKNVTYDFECDNIDIGRTFDVTIELFDDSTIETTVFRPLMEECDGFVVGEGILLGGGFPIGPFTMLSFNSTLVNCGVYQDLTPPYVLQSSCSQNVPIWVSDLGNTFRVRFSNTEVSSISSRPSRQRERRVHLLDGFLEFHEDGEIVKSRVFSVNGDVISHDAFRHALSDISGGVLIFQSCRPKFNSAVKYYFKKE